MDDKVINKRLPRIKIYIKTKSLPGQYKLIKKNNAEFLTIKTKLVYVLILSMTVGIKPQLSFNGHTLKITLPFSFKIPTFTCQKLYPFI